MKVGIVGGSNAVMRHGWTAIVDKFHEVEKYARGSCASSVGIYKAIETSLPLNNDFLISNFGLSEHSEIQSGGIDENHLKFLIGALYAMFAASGKPALSVMFPLRSTADLSYPLHKNLAEEHGVFFVDGYLFVEEVCKAYPSVDIVSLYRSPKDKKHLKPEVANFLGLACLEVIKLLRDKTPRGSVPRMDADFEVVNSSSCFFNKFARHTYGRGRYAEEVIFLEEGDSLEIPYDGFLHGIYVDSEHSNAFLEFESGGVSVSKNMANIKLDRDKPLFKMLTFKSPFAVSRVLRIRNVGACNSGQEFTRNSREISLDAPRRAVVAGLLFSRHCADKEVIPVPKGYNEIQEDIDQIVRDYAKSLVSCFNIVGGGVLPTFADGGQTDIANKGKAKQSSTSKWSKKNDAQRATYDLADEYAFHTDRQINPWWYIQFDSIEFVDKIIIENRRNRKYFSRAYALRIEIFDSSFTSTTILEGAVEFGTYQDLGPLVLPVSAELRSIRITVLGKGVLHLANVKVYQ